MSAQGAKDAINIKTKRGLDWHVEISGGGDAILMIHGFGGSGHWWQAQNEFLEPHHQVITVDLPGHGQSAWMPLSLTEMADDIHQIGQQLNIFPLTIVASSFGGLVALELYRLMPSEIMRMSLVGALPKFARGPHYPAGLDIEKIRTLSRQIKGDYASVLDIFFRSLFTMRERFNPRMLWVKKMRQQEPLPSQEALRHFLDILEKADLRDRLSSVICPLQFITGTHDYICPKPMMDWVAEHTPNARFDFMEGCGHLPFLTEPQEYNRLLEDFLLN